MMPEDMSEADREARERSLDELYHTRARKDLLKVQLLRLTRKNSPGWAWRGDFTTRRGTGGGPDRNRLRGTGGLGGACIIFCKRPSRGEQAGSRALRLPI